MLFDKHGRVVPIAHYQLPEYRWDVSADRSALIEAAVKSVVIERLMAAGAVVVQELVDAVDRDLLQETKRANRPVRRRRTSSR